MLLQLAQIKICYVLPPINLLPAYLAEAKTAAVWTEI